MKRVEIVDPNIRGALIAWIIVIFLFAIGMAVYFLR